MASLTSGINPATIEARELFDLLESPQQFVVDDIKALIQENVNTTKDSWLVAGLYDYYIHTNSTPCMEILLSLSKEPHDKFLIEKIIEGLRSPQQQTSARKLSVIFLGHLVRKQPSWLYKIVNHGLVKELIKLLKVETDVVIIMTGLLVLTTILPMLPTYLIPFVNDIFEVFGRLVIWTQSSHVQLLEEHILHILVGLYSLFHRLYAMFPCNFLSFLRHNFSPADKRHIFLKTIKPMLETVKMHPLLVVATKEGELSPNRWKNKEYHDIIAEYAEISLDVLESGSSEEFTPLSLRPRLSMCTPAAAETHTITDRFAATQALQKLPVSPLILQAMKLDQNELTSLSAHIDETAPPTPMSAIVSHSHASTVSPAPPPSVTSTPSMVKNVTASPPEAGVEATPENTPISTPIKEREHRTHFKLPPPGSPAVAQLTFGKASATPHTPPSTPFNSVPTSPAPHTAGEGPVMFGAPGGPNLNRRDSIFDTIRRDTNTIMYQRLQKVVAEQQQHSAAPGPRGMSDDSMPTGVGSGARPSPLTLGDAVITLEPLPGSDSLALGGDGPLTPLLGSHPEESSDEHDELAALQSVPGVPMPDTRSMIAFAKRVSRLRYYSHCGEQGTTGSTGGPSPGTSPSSSNIATYIKTKRSLSCPDVRKKSILEMEESGGGGGPDSMDGSSISTTGAAGQHQHFQEEDEITPTLEAVEPYEHLFDGVLPQFLQHPGENKRSIQSPHHLLDLCLSKAATLHAPKRGDELAVLTGQVELLHCQLLFERHRRESHALRNRNLAKKCRNIQQKEEQNCALRSQLHSLEKEVAILKKDVMVQRTMAVNKEHQLQLVMKDLELKLQQQKGENTLQLEKMSNLEKKHEKTLQEHQALLKETDQRKADIFQLESEVKHCKKYVEVNNELKAAFESSQKEILLLGELARRQQEVIANHEPHRYLLHEMEDLRLTCEDEIRNLKNMLESKSSQAEAALGFIQNLEAQIAKKDAILAEQKKMLQDSSAVYEIQLKAMEDKYTSVKKCNQRLEFEILNLNHQVAMKNCSMRSSSSSQRRISPNGESPHNSNASDVDSAASAGGMQLSPERSQLIFGSLQFDSPSGELNDLQRVIESEAATTTAGAAGYNELPATTTVAPVGPSRHLPPRQLSSQSRHDD